MKIALISTPFRAVPPREYGGTQRILDCFGKALIDRGVDVTLYASGDSTTSVPIQSIVQTSLFNDSSYDHTTQRAERMNAINGQTIGLIRQGSEPDLINCHDYDNPDLIRRLSELDIPTLVTIRHAKTPLISEVYDRFKGYSNVFFSGLTRKQVEDLDSEMPFVHNGINVRAYCSVGQDKKRSYFFSIGDMKPIKGHRTAIQFAKRSGLDLIIAGAPYYPESKPYFEKEIIPNIDLDVSQQQDLFLRDIRNGTFNFKDGKVVYFGTASDRDKRVLFSHARFTQFLGNLEVAGNIEACPGVVLESVLSGTPVLGVNGSVTSELLDEGVTGLNVDNLDGAVAKVGDFSEFGSQVVRSVGVERFSSERMASGYIGLYEKVLGSGK